MKFLRDVENIVKDRLLPIWLFAFGILSILTTPTRLTDHTHEIQIIGSAWFRGGSIPLVQAFSNFGPLSLYIGSIYDRFITNSFTARLSEVALFSIISLLLYSWVKIRHANNVSYQNTLLILGLLIIVIPGVWQVGISSGKIGLVFLLGVYYFYDRWQQSSKSFWLFGETARNSRLLLGAGIMLSGLLFSSLLISLFALPVLISFIRTLLKDPTYGLRQAIVFLTPVALHGWLWYSYFASRGLVSEALRASILDFRLALDGAGLDNLLSVALIFPIAVLILFVILAIRRGNYRSSRKTWVIGIALLLAIIGSSAGMLLSLPFIFLLAVPLYLNNLRLSMVALWCGVGLAAVLPYRYLSSSQAKLESAQAQVATAYVEQRLIDTNYVLYYGNGAGFFKDSNLASSTRYYNSAVFAYDNDSFQLVDKFRGDNEANTPRYVIYATSKESAVGNVPRIEEYFKKHYDEITALDGYKILKRR